MNDEQRREAFATLQAYNAMETTKQRHFDFITVLEMKKKKFNINPTDADNELLADLLRDHDEQVKAFTDTAQALKSASPDAHQALFAYIGQINEVLGHIREAH